MKEIIRKKYKGNHVIRLKWVTLDGKEQVKVECPICKTWAYADDDQYNGRVSLQCATEGCTFHETINLAEL